MTPRSAPPLAGTVVIRDGIVVYASAGAAALAGYAADDAVGRPFADFLVPEHRRRLEERYARRVRGEPVPSEYEAELLRPDGGRRAVEIRIAVDGTDFVVALRDITALEERRARLAGIARLGVDVLRERDEEAIFARVREGLWDAGLSSFLMHPEPQGVRVSWACVPRVLASTFEAIVGEPLVGFVAPWTAFTRAGWEDGGAFTDDWLQHASDLLPPAIAAAARGAAAEEGPVRAVAVRIDERAAPRYFLLAIGPWLRAEDVSAMRLLGGQVGAALDAARTIAGLAQHNVDLAALNRLGELVGESSDLAAFLAQAAVAIRGAAGSDGVAVFTAADGGRELVQRFAQGAPADSAGAFARIPVEGEIADLLRSRTPRTTRASALAPEHRERLRGLGFGTYAWVPLVSRAGVPGLMTLGWRDELPADAVRLGFLQAAGAQLAAAIESFGLLATLRGRVGELTLLNDLAMGTAALDPSLLLENALRGIAETVGADGGTAFVLEDDTLVSAATLNVPAWFYARYGRLRKGEGAAGRAVERLAPVVVDHLPALGEPYAALAEQDGFQRMVSVPLLSKSRALGALTLARKSERGFTPDEVALLSTIGAQLGVALDNARLYTEARRRAEELALLHEVGRSLVSTLHLDEVLEAGTRNLARIVDAPLAFLMLADRERDALEIRATTDPGAALLGARFPLRDPEASLSAWVFHHRAPLLVEDAFADPRVNAAARDRVGARSYLAVPLVVRDLAIGVALVVESRGPRRFTPAEVERANGIANQIAVAVENARLYDDLSRSYVELAQAQRQLVHRERLAALGELAAVVAHEVRNPLGVIFNSLGSIRRLVRPTGDAALLLDIVGEEADRLNRIVSDLLDFARPATPVLEPGSLERVVEDAVSATAAQAPPGVTVERTIEPGLPAVPMDARLVRQAVVNLVGNAVQAMPRGGAVRVRLARRGDAVAVEVEDEGPGVAEELRARVFEPFFTTKASGTGLGLAVVKRIMDGHGGDVTVGGRPGEGAVFTLRFPLPAAAPPAPGVASGARIG